MRLIDADRLLFMMFHYYDCVNENTEKAGYKGETLMDYEVAGMIDDCIENAPTIDAVVVVRCKDCRKRRKNGTCNVIEMTVADDGFCDLGEPLPEAPKENDNAEE